MCTGRVDLEFVFRSFSNGMDGVFIGGCRLNECNYVTQGNYHALTMALLSRRIMEYIGLNPERLSIEFMSGGEGVRFAQVSNAFVKKIKALGPLGASEGIGKGELNSRLAEARRLFPYIKRVKNDKLATRLENEEQYNTFFTSEEINILFRDAVSYYIDPVKCEACMICARRCPAGAIASARNQIHVVDQQKCIKCDKCFEVCPTRFGAVTKIVGKPVPPPVPKENRTIVRRGKEN